MPELSLPAMIGSRSDASVNVPANGSTTLTVTVNTGQPSGTVVQGWINLDGPGSNDLHFAYYAIVGH